MAAGAGVDADGQVAARAAGRVAEDHLRLVVVVVVVVVTAREAGQLRDDVVIVPVVVGVAVGMVVVLVAVGREARRRRRPRSGPRSWCACR